MSNLYPVTTIGNPNLLINSDFQVWQRGTSFQIAKNGDYTADRWKTFIDTTSSTDSINTRRSSGRMLISGSNKRYVVYQYIELNDQIKATLSAYKSLTASATFVCNADMQIGMSVLLFKSGDRIQTNIGTITESFTKGKPNTIKFTCDVTGIDLTDYDLIQFNLCNVPANYAGNNVYVYWGKLEYGEVATPYIPRTETEELMLCSRYYTSLGNVTIIPLANTSTTYYMPINGHFLVPMRAVPSIQYKYLRTTTGIALDNVTASFVGRTTNLGITSTQLSKAQSHFSVVVYSVTADAEI